MARATAPVAVSRAQPMGGGGACAAAFTVHRSGASRSGPLRPRARALEDEEASHEGPIEEGVLVVRLGRARCEGGAPDKAPPP